MHLRNIETQLEQPTHGNLHRCFTRNTGIPSDVPDGNLVREKLGVDPEVTADQASTPDSTCKLHGGGHIENTPMQSPRS